MGSGASPERADEAPVKADKAFERAKADRARREADLLKSQLERLMAELSQIDADLQSVTPDARAAIARPGRTLKRKIVSSTLASLSRLRFLPTARRKRFAKSSVKRDPSQISSELGRIAGELYHLTANSDLIATLETLVSERSRLTVTAIVPNYNHAAFLRQRLDSILNQTYQRVDVVILDDCSTDNSREIISEYVSRYPDRVQAIFNRENSGGVFRQWRKGHEAARGDLVWFCESDDFCEPDFVARLIPRLTDPSVLLAFGKIDFVDGAGQAMDGLDHYRETAEAGIWSRTLTRPASAWFAGGFGVSNVIANVGGSIWRRFPIPEEVWAEAQNYKVAGDWYLYSVIAGGGQIAFEPRARAYFRIHDRNTSVVAQKTPEYYREYSRFMTSLRKRWPVPTKTLHRFVEGAHQVFRQQGDVSGLGHFGDLVNEAKLGAVQREVPHVLIVFLGFAFGGGELFPIHLANALHAQGVVVSMLQLTKDFDRDEVREMLDPSIAVYQADRVATSGIDRFLADAGVSLIHSHIVSAEMFFFETHVTKTRIPYIATLHGSYEAMTIEKRRVSDFARRIDRFVYTADRNLEPILDLGIPPDHIIKMSNGVPLDPRPFPLSRAEMGIPEDAVVFAFVARGIKRKGWRAAIEAFKALQSDRTDREMFLLMVGEGEEVENGKILAADHPNIRFLGYQTCIHGLYRLADVALAPTRFEGESYPLCLIQAMQTGRAIVSSDVGDIARMVRADGLEAGILVDAARDTGDFVNKVRSAMDTMLDDQVRSGYAAASGELGSRYSIAQIAESYRAMYHDVIAEARTEDTA